MGSLEKELATLFQMVMLEYEKVESKAERKYFDEVFGSTRSPEVALQNITLLFRHYASKVDTLLRQSRSSQDYGELEKVLQTQQAEIRNHIRLEQQMKLYAESVQSKLEECEKSKADMQNEYKLTIQNLKRQNQRLQDDFRLLKEKDLNSLVSSYSTNKSKPYIPRYETENRKTPTKLQDARDVQKHTNTSSNLSTMSKLYHHGQPAVQEASFHRTYQQDCNNLINRSHSRDQQLRKQHSRINSIHLLSKKSSMFSKK